MPFQPVKPEESLAPVATMLVSPESFHASWKRRPKANVLVGLRPLAKIDWDFCSAEARRRAIEAFPFEKDESIARVARLDSYNDWLMAYGVVRGTCDPNDAKKGWEEWRGAGEDNVAFMLTREGIKAIYDAVERSTIASSPVAAPASDEEIVLLQTMTFEALDKMPKARALRARRLFSFLLDECRGFATDDAAE